MSTDTDTYEPFVNAEMSAHLAKTSLSAIEQVETLKYRYTATKPEVREALANKHNLPSQRAREVDERLRVVRRLAGRDGLDEKEQQAYVQRIQELQSQADVTHDLTRIAYREYVERVAPLVFLEVTEDDVDTHELDGGAVLEAVEDFIARGNGAGGWLDRLRSATQTPQNSSRAR